jgi:hypothetical protein
MHTLRVPPFKTFSLALAVLLAGSLTVDAKVKVIESDVPGIAVNSEWDSEASLKVPAGKSVRVLLLPSKITKVISGGKVGGEAEMDKSIGGTRDGEVNETEGGLVGQ